MSTLPPRLPEKQPPCTECGGRWSVGGHCAACAYGDLLSRPADDRARRDRLLTTHHAHAAGHWYLTYHDGASLGPLAPGSGVELLAVRAAWWRNPAVLARGHAFVRELWDHPQWSVVPPLGVSAFGPWVAVRWRVWWQGAPGFLQLERRPGQDWPGVRAYGGFDPGRADAAAQAMRSAAGLAEKRGRRSLKNDPSHPWRHYADLAIEARRKDPQLKAEHIVFRLGVPGKSQDAKVRKLRAWVRLRRKELAKDAE